jgi:MSHA biogenesis protein MshQ
MKHFLQLLALIGFGLGASKVAAAIYTLPDNNLPNCTLNNTYTCPYLYLGYRDILFIDGNSRVTINVTGNMTMGAEVRLNPNSDPGQLTINTTHNFTGGHNNEINANISSGGRLRIDNETPVRGSLFAQGNLTLGFKSTLEGDARSISGTLNTENEVQVLGNLSASGDVSLGFQSDIEGSIASDGNLVVENEVGVTGDIDTNGSVSLSFLSEVTGNIKAGSEVTLQREVTVDGNVNASDTVRVADSSVITGYVNAPEIIGKDNIRGETCDINNNIGPCSGTAPDEPLVALGHWTFDESRWQGSEGEVLDSSGNNLHGRALRGAGTLGTDSAIAGSPGTCRYGMFDGDSSVRIDNASTIAKAESVSVAFWFKGRAEQQEQWESYQTLLMIGDGPTEGRHGRFEVYRQDHSDGGGIYFEIRTNRWGGSEIIHVEAGNTDQGQANLLDGRWHHLAASFDQSKKRLKLYIDGSLIDETSFSGRAALNDVDDRLYIGGQGNSTNSFNGEMDEVFIGDRALTQSEVRRLKEQTRPCGDGRPLCEAVWPQGGTSGNSVPLPFSLPGSHWDEQLPADLKPIDYLRTGDFDDVGENYSTDGQTSRVYIDGDLTIQSGRRINMSGDANELMLIITGDLHLASDVKINGYIYVEGDLSYEQGYWPWTSPPEVTGGISVGGSVSNDDGRWWDRWWPADIDITYQPPVNPIEGGSFCRANYSEPPVATVHHYELSYSSPALTCTGAEVDIKACANANCSETYTAGATVELNSVAGEWSDNPVSASPIGHATLKQTTAGVYPLAVESNGTAPAAPNPTQCRKNGILSGDCTIEFSDTGFVFTDGNNLSHTDLPAQISAKPYSNLRLWAVETNSQTLACQAVLEPLNSVSMSLNCVDPEVCLMGATVNGSDITENTFTEVGINFDSGKAELAVSYPDAGAITLTAKAELPNGEIQGTSQAFVWRPDSIRIETAQSTPGNYEGDILAKAGEAFSVQLTALNSEGDVTPNFGNELAAQTLQLKGDTEATDSSAVRNGVLSNESGFTKLKEANGVFENTGVSYSEVGSTQVTAYIGSENYLPGYHLEPIKLEVSGNNTEIGRFIPHKFKQLTAEFTGSCTDFYYMGQPQPISLSAQAVNASGEVTQNYTGELAEATPLFYAYDESENELTAHDVSHNGSWQWDSGVAQFIGGATVTVSRLASGQPNGPYENYKLGWQLDDHEGGNFYSILENSQLPEPVTLSVGAAELGTSSLYYGRVNLQETFAAIGDQMPVAGTIEYWNGTQFVANRNDACETFNNDAHTYVEGSSTGPVPERLEPLLAVTADEGKLAPTSRNIDELLRWESGDLEAEPHTFTFELEVPDYLKYDWPYNDGEADDGSGYTDSPRAEGTFGIYRGSDRQIYWRELGW